MNWIERAVELFNNDRPVAFTETEHCLECNDHNETLLSSDRESISFDKLDNAGWAPIYFVNDEGYLYYFPAFVRLCEKSNGENYHMGQFLFHLTYDGIENRRIPLFNEEQKLFVFEFLEYLVEEKIELIREYGDEDILEDALCLLEPV